MTIFRAAAAVAAINAAAAGQLDLDDANGYVIVKESPEWVVSVTPMLFGDRVLWSARDEYPGYSGGWCYAKGGAAILAALAWNPDIERRPAGFIQEATDRR